MMKEEVEKLGKTVDTIFDKLEPTISKLQSQETGVAELKEQVNKAAQDIKESTDKLEKYREELNKRADDFEVKMKERFSEKGGSIAFKTVSDVVFEHDSRLVKGYKYTKDDSGVEVVVPGDETKGLQHIRYAKGSTAFKFKSWNLSREGRLLTATKEITDAAGSAQDATTQMRIAGIVAPPQRRLVIRDLFLIGRTSESNVEWVRESAVTGTPADQGTQGSEKAEMDFDFTLESSAVRTIAGYAKASTQILSDVAQMQSYLNGRMTQKLLEAEEASILLGSGVNSILGVIPQATAYSSALEAQIVSGTVTPVDRVRVAITQVYNANGIPDGLVFSPTDWATIELSKTDDGAYLFVNPVSGADPRLWGFPAAVSNALTSPQSLVGAFRSGAQIWDREDASFMVSTQNEDDFIKNMVTLKAEERLALTVYQTTHFVEFNIDGTGSGS